MSAVSNPLIFNIKDNYNSKAEISYNGLKGTINCAHIKEYGGTWGENTYNYYGYKVTTESGKVGGSINPNTYKNVKITGIFYFASGLAGVVRFAAESDVGYVCIKINNTIVFKGYSGENNRTTDKAIFNIFKNIGTNQTLEIRSYDF